MPHTVPNKPKRCGGADGGQRHVTVVQVLLHTTQRVAQRTGVLGLGVDLSGQ